MKFPLIPRRNSISAAVCAASIFALASCGDKSKPEDPAKAAAEAAESVASASTVELVRSSSFNSKRTQAFGFLSRLPATTEGAFGIRNLSDLVSGVLESNTYKRVLAMAEEFGETGIDPQQVQMVQAMIDQYVGKELFVICGGGSAVQFQRLQFITGLLSDMNMRAAGMGAASGGAGGPEAMQAAIAGIRDQLKDPNSEASKALDAFQLPPLIFGSKVTDGAEEVIAHLDALEAELPQIFTVSKVDAGGGKFTSWRLHLQDVITEGTEAEIDEFLKDPAASKRVADILRKKTVEFTFGTVDNYLLFTLGADHKHLDFVSKPEDSILAASAFGFTDQFLDKKLVGYSFMSKALLAGGAKGGQFERMAEAFATGLAEADTSLKKVGELLQKLAGQAEKLSKRSAQTYVGLVYSDAGLRGDSIGGYATDTVDWKSNSQFANSAPADAALVISSVANPKYRGESIAMIETAFSLIDEGVNVFAEKSGGPQQAVEMLGMFEENLTTIWGILKGKFIEGLGSQSGIIVDLKGAMPKGLIPDFPNVLENEGKLPRIALAADVTDRAKIAEAWAELVPALNETIAKIPGQDPGAEVQVPDVMSDEADDLVTHYFSFPFFSNDFMPSISLNDKLFLMSTSKQFAQELAAKAGGGTGGGEIRGTYMMMNLAELQRYAESWIDLVLKNSATVFQDELQADQFEETAAQIQALLEFTRGIRSFKANRFQDDAGAMRSSWHLHIEDIGPAVD